MYLSQLVLNEQTKLVYGDLANAHKLHQRIMQSFPDESIENPRHYWKILYRQEPDIYKILVQSAVEPDWRRLPQNYLLNSSVKQVNWEQKKLSVGYIYQFRLKANPSKRDKESGKTIGMFNHTDQVAWLERKANEHGFGITSVDVIPVAKIYGKKNKTSSPIQIYNVTFQGILQVTDLPQFIQALIEGIGRGRSYGCGLLSIAKINHN